MEGNVTVYHILAIIGAGAWLYPLGVLIYKVIIKPKVRISPAETIEIGYTTYGPILNLQCAISTSRRDVLIERIEANITHENGDSHCLTWKVLDETQSYLEPLSGEGGGTLSKRIAALALKVSLSEPNQKKILFQDNQFHEKSRIVLQALIEKVTFIKRSGTGKLRERVLETKESGDLIDFLKNYFFWKSGRYFVELHMHAPSSKTNYSERFRFSLEQHEVDSLKNNLDQLETALLPSFDPEPNTEDTSPPLLWNWAYPRIDRVTSESED